MGKQSVYQQFLPPKRRKNDGKADLAAKLTIALVAGLLMGIVGIIILLGVVFLK